MFISAFAGPIFESKALTAALIVSILSVIPYYAIVGRAGVRDAIQRHVNLFFLFWLAVLTFEFYFLGPYSFIEQTGEGNLNVAFNHYLTHGYDGGRFSHQYGGGQDTYSLLIGKQFFNPERFFLAIFPLWIAVLLHKIFVGTLGFVGAFLLARHMAPENRAGAAAIGAMFTVSHFYLLNLSTNWSPGFAVMPLVIYLCIACSGRAGYWRGVLLAALLLTPADPIHVFPALVVTAIGAIILMDGVDLKRVMLSFFLLILCSIANWHEVLYAYYQNVGLTIRIMGAEDLPGFLDSTWQSVRHVATKMPFVGSISLICLGVLVVKQDRLRLRVFFALALALLSYPIAEIFPWHWIGLGFLNRLSNHYLLISLTTFLPLVLARTFASVGEVEHIAEPPSLKLKPEAALLAIALAMLTWNKLLNLGLLVWFGGQGNLIAYETLRSDDWKPEEDFRVVTPFETPNANIVAGMYRIDSFDGQFNMGHTGWEEYWKSILHRDPTHILKTRIGFKGQYWDGKAYDVESHLRLDLLGIANVRFLLSALPIKSGGLKPIVVPAAEEQAKHRPDFFKSQMDFLKFRLKRIFDPGKHYIYELPRFLPRVFAATGVEAIDEDADSVTLHNRVADVAPDGVIVVSRDDARLFEGLATLKNVRYSKITNGYEVSLDAPDGGILVLNNMYVPFWVARTGDGRRLEIVPANAVQMAIAVPPGVKKIQALYRRPLLREKIAASSPAG